MLHSNNLSAIHILSYRNTKAADYIKSLILAVCTRRSSTDSKQDTPICCKSLNNLKVYVSYIYNIHLPDISGNIRDFMDTLILTRLEAEEDPIETNLENLSQAHLIQTVSDIFFGRCHGL